MCSSKPSISGDLSVIEQDLGEKESSTVEKQISAIKRTSSVMSKEIKPKYGSSSYLNKYSSIKLTKQHPMSRRRSASVTSHLTNASTKAVLFERNVEIKDLESKVKYLQNKIKELENENRTLVGVQSRQDKELKNFKEGVADIPSLLRSHKEEKKVYESTISNIRRELRDCQKEVKVRNDAIFKKDSQIDKLNVLIKRNEKVIHDTSHEVKEFKTAKTVLEEENKTLIATNKTLKSENDGLHQKIKEMSNQIKILEENINKEIKLNKQLKDDLKTLQEEHKDEELRASNITQCLVAEEQDTFTSKYEALFKVLSCSPNNAGNGIFKNSSQDESKQPKESLPVENKETTSSIKDVDRCPMNSLKNGSKNFENLQEGGKKWLESSFKDEDRKLENSCENECGALDNLTGVKQNLGNVPVNEINNSLIEVLHGENLQHDQSLDNTKDGLLQNFKYHQDVCSTRLGSSSRLSCGMKTSNLKPLPPVKTSSRKSVQVSDSASISKQCFSSDNRNGKKFAANAAFNDEKNLAANAAFNDEKNLAANATVHDGIGLDGNATSNDGKKHYIPLNAKEVDKFFRFGKLGKEFHCKLKSDDRAAVKSEYKTSNFKEVLRKDKYAFFSEFSKQDGSNSQPEISWLDDW